MKNYDDILNFRYTGSEYHARMPREARAAQFAPFAAMVGHDEVIAEVRRLTDKRIELDEEAIRELDERLRYLDSIRESSPEVSITYFKPDERKAGGAYLTVSGSLSMISKDTKTVILSSGVSVPIEEIVDVSSPLFDRIE